MIIDPFAILKTTSPITTEPTSEEKVAEQIGRSMQRLRDGIVKERNNIVTYFNESLFGVSPAAVAAIYGTKGATMLGVSELLRQALVMMSDAVGEDLTTGLKAATNAWTVNPDSTITPGPIE